MKYSPLLILHICAAIIGLLSGAVALAFRKGFPWHRVAGNVFFVSMLSMAGVGAFLALVKQKPGDILGGMLTCYLVATAWKTARRREGKLGIFDWSALLVALALASVAATFGLEAVSSPTGLKYGYPFGPYFFLGSVALISLAGDVRMLVRGGISGAQRIARHLWRMCFALFIASASIFLARQHLFPELLRKTGVLVFLSVLPLLLMILWLLRVRFTKTYKIA
jgi:uncharacterized membrane protein